MRIERVALTFSADTLLHPLRPAGFAVSLAVAAVPVRDEREHDESV